VVPAEPDVADAPVAVVVVPLCWLPHSWTRRLFCTWRTPGMSSAMSSARRHRDVLLSAAEAIRYGLADALRAFALPKGSTIFQI
jgi:hypothetical protein